MATVVHLGREVKKGEEGGGGGGGEKVRKKLSIYIKYMIEETYVSSCIMSCIVSIPSLTYLESRSIVEEVVMRPVPGTSIIVVELKSEGKEG